jgi:hypothetical protein
MTFCRSGVERQGAVFNTFNTFKPFNRYAPFKPPLVSSPATAGEDKEGVVLSDV